MLKWTARQKKIAKLLVAGASAYTLKKKYGTDVYKIAVAVQEVLHNSNPPYPWDGGWTKPKASSGSHPQVKHGQTLGGQLPSGVEKGNFDPSVTGNNDLNVTANQSLLTQSSPVELVQPFAIAEVQGGYTPKTVRQVPLTGPTYAIKLILQGDVVEINAKDFAGLHLIWRAWRDNGYTGTLMDLCRECMVKITKMMEFRPKTYLDFIK